MLLRSVKNLILVGSMFLISVLVSSCSSLIGGDLDTESKQYVDRVIPLILKDMDHSILMDHASDEFKAVTKPGQLPKLFDWFKTLGEFKEYKGSEGQAIVSITNKGKKISAKYIAHVEFEKAPATIQIIAVKKDDRWFIHGFHLNSDGLLPDQSS